MDGTIAAIVFLGGLLEMGTGHCPTGCLAPSETDRRLSFQGGAVEFQREVIGEELYLGYDFGTARGPFQPTVGLSVTDAGAVWVGAGAKVRWELGPDVFVEGSIMPGYYEAGDGPDLGGSLQFRSALGVGYEFAGGATVTVLYDHRSNAGIEDLNPGLETLSIRYAIPLD